MHQRVGLFLSGVVGFDEVKKGEGATMSGIETKGTATVIVTLSNPDPIFDQKIATHLIPPVKMNSTSQSS